MTSERKDNKKLAPMSMEWFKRFRFVIDLTEDKDMPCGFLRNKEEQREIDDCVECIPGIPQGYDQTRELTGSDIKNMDALFDCLVGKEGYSKNKRDSEQAIRLLTLHTKDAVDAMEYYGMEEVMTKENKDMSRSDVKMSERVKMARKAICPDCGSKLKSIKAKDYHPIASSKLDKSAWGCTNDDCAYRCLTDMDEVIKNENSIDTNKQATTKTLLVWERAPEGVDFYLLNATDEQLKVLDKCNGKLINVCDDEDALNMLNKLSDALCDNKEYVSGENPEWHCIWANNKIKLPLNEHIERVYHAGFYL